MQVSTEVKYNKLDNFNTANEIMDTARLLIESKIIPAAYKTPEQVLVSVMKGRELGLGAITSLENLYYINGVATASINLLLALATKAGVAIKTLKDFEPVYQEVRDDKGAVVLGPDGQPSKKVVDYETVIRVYRKHEYLGMVIENDVVFRFSEAREMGLTGKDNWVKQKRNMTWVRCAARALRRFAGDAILGMYETTEMADSKNINYSIDEENNVTIQV